MLEVIQWLLGVIIQGLLRVFKYLYDLFFRPIAVLANLAPSIRRTVSTPETSVKIRDGRIPTLSLEDSNGDAILFYYRFDIENNNEVPLDVEDVKVEYDCAGFRGEITVPDSNFTVLRTVPRQDSEWQTIEIQIPWDVIHTQTRAPYMIVQLRVGLKARYRILGKTREGSVFWCERKFTTKMPKDTWVTKDGRDLHELTYSEARKEIG